MRTTHMQGVMDASWLGAANDAVDAMEPRAPPPGEGQTIKSWNEQFPDDAEAVPSEEVLGIGGVRLGGEFTWPQPLCQPFRRMIADKQLFERLDWILGQHARLDDARGLLLSHPGTMGHSLHSGPMRQHAYVSAGSPFVLGWADSVNVAWQLRYVHNSTLLILSVTCSMEYSMCVQSCMYGRSCRHSWTVL